MGKSVIAHGAQCSLGPAPGNRIIERMDGSRWRLCARCGAELAQIVPPSRRWSDEELRQEAERRWHQRDHGLPLHPDGAA